MRRAPWQLALVAGVLVPGAALVLRDAVPAAAIAASLLGSGAALALLLIPEMSVLLWLGAGSAFGVGILLVHGLLRAVFPFFAETPFVLCLAATALGIGAASALVLWRARWPRALRWGTRSDIVFLLALLPVLASTWAVARANGYATGSDGREEFRARGFVNGDTMTLFALVKRYVETPRGDPTSLRSGAEARGAGNPFAGGGPLEYPTLLHGALADVMAAAGGDITRAVWWLIVPVLIGTVAVSVLSIRVIVRAQRVPLWAVLMLLAAFGTTWESFTYPQSHTFLTGLFLLVVLLLVLRDQSERASELRVRRLGVGTLTIVLLFSNAVLGTAAVVLAVGSNLLQAFNRSWSLRDRVAGLIGSGILLVLFFLFPPGEGRIGALNVAYTAVPQFLTAALPALVVLWALWDTGWLHRSAGLLGAGVLLPALGLATLVLSGRDIIAENSPRFLFLLVLLGWPAVIPLVQRIADWWWREVRHVEHALTEHAVLWGGGAFLLVVLLLPTAASVAGTLDNLVRKVPLVVSADELDAFAWIRANTSPQAVFLRAPESVFDDPSVAPLSLPAFTGRAQLRSEYWLSPDDALLEDIRRFFSGESGMPAGATHLFCGPERRECPSHGTTVFAAGKVTIRALE